MKQDSLIAEDIQLAAIDVLNDEIYTPSKILGTPLMQSRIRRYMHAIVDMFRRQFSGNAHLRLDIKLLRVTVESCLCDIYRLKVFRGIQQEDNHKRAAFFMVWLARIKPIQRVDIIRDEAVVKANELLALFFGLNILGISPKNLFELCPAYMSNILYLLHFRACSPEQLASELFLLERQIKL